ncbi:hypothetical protein LTR02_009119 [Friedmanniomyces endolithicus]|nr:hypothetical protein LTR02_009119 [Friedmanniomyces endolithicus]
MANYNGTTTLKSDCGALTYVGYTSVRPEGPTSEPLRSVSDCGVRLFTPLVLPGLGTFQDGALRHNSPVNIALWEGSRIWSRDTQRDVVLSLGTGTGQDTKPPEDSFAPNLQGRLYPSAMSLDGELTWRHLLNHLEKDAEHRYFRLNVQFGDQEPRLDDIGAMEKLSQDVNLSKNDQQLTEIKLALLASSFFFELKRAPKFDASGFYICQGEIRVRGDHTKVFMALRQMSNGHIEFHKDGVPLGKADHSTDVCSGCYRFRKKVCFFVRHPAEIIALTITMDKSRRHISGFPQKTLWFTHEQHLADPFYSEETLSFSSQACPCLAVEQARAGGMVKRKLSSIHLPSDRRKRRKTLSSLE